LITLKIGIDDSGARLDRLLRKSLPLTKLSDIYRLVRTGRIRINGKKTKQDYRLQELDTVEMDIDQSELPIKNTSATEALVNLAKTDFFKRNLNIIFEDEDLIACNKPPNLVVHPGTGHNVHDTLIDIVKSYVLTKKHKHEANEPTLVHRIDRDTSGIVLIAKNKRMLRYLHSHFRDHQIDKKYIAVCNGRPPKKSGVIEVKLAKTLERNSGTKVTVDENGQPSKSHYVVLQSNGRFSTLQVTIGTGRTHQIRVHLAHIGCPVVGDVRYGDKDLDKALFMRRNISRRLYLHAHLISFIHPLDNKRLTLTAPVPVEFSSFMKETEAT
jgi:23S rRNA pseudouridine955/2504/2580 synthase